MLHFHPIFRTMALGLLFACSGANACTAFKVTKDGRTMVGNNEDAWSINTRIRFERGGPGEFGAVYFSNFNGQPFRSVLDQGGMNEAGLMFDGFGVPTKIITGPATKPLGEFVPLLQEVMRTCSTVQEAAAVFRRYDMRLLAAGMLWLVDRQGNYLVVEGDTLFTGNDAVYAVGNFRPSQCTDFDAVAIPRYQKGRALLATGADTSLAYCTEVMHTMQACRKKLGEGTLYTDILDLEHGMVHLYFYHDFTERRSFDLRAELAKGDHSYAIAGLFGPRAEYDRLLAYATPFHQRWVFWGMVLLAGVACIAALYAVIALLHRGILRLRGRARKGSARPTAVVLLASLVMIFLAPFLIVNEGIFYFGLGDAVDGFLPALKYLPLLLGVLCIPLVVWTFRRWRGRAGTSLGRWCLTLFAGMQAAFVVMLAYWDLLFPMAR